jgi:hypothetical protein
MQLTYAEPIPYELVERVVAVMPRRRIEDADPSSGGTRSWAAGAPVRSPPSGRGITT